MKNRSSQHGCAVGAAQVVPLLTRVGKWTWAAWACALMMQSAVAVAAPRPVVWFAPAAFSPDLLDLFEHPNAWQSARSKINVFMFHPASVDPRFPARIDTFQDLKSIGAFSRLTSWGIKTAIAVPAVKEWDCTGRAAAKVTEGWIRNVDTSGGRVRILAMDEPLVSGLGYNGVCHLGVDETAKRTAAYVRRVSSDPGVREFGVLPQFVEMEPYPSFSVGQIEGWVAALRVHGFTPAAFFLDVAVHYVNLSPQRKSRLPGDLQELRRFFKEQGIPMGIIIWCGRGGVRSDREYYDLSMRWTRTVHTAIGTPDQIMFNSWVKRCPDTGLCPAKTYGCPSGARYCGITSVPDNLPEDGAGVFSHTRLVNDALGVFDTPG